ARFGQSRFRRPADAFGIGHIRLPPLHDHDQRIDVGKFIATPAGGQADRTVHHLALLGRQGELDLAHEIVVHLHRAFLSHFTLLPAARHCKNVRNHFPIVMPALVTTSRVYPTCGAQKRGTRASPSSDGIHVFLSTTNNTWMAGTSPAMTTGLVSLRTSLLRVP